MFEKVKHCMNYKFHFAGLCTKLINQLNSVCYTHITAKTSFDVLIFDCEFDCINTIEGYINLVV